MDATEVSLPVGLYEWFEAHTKDADALMSRLVKTALTDYAKKHGWGTKAKAPAKRGKGLVAKISTQLKHGDLSVPTLAKWLIDTHPATIRSALYRLEAKGLVIQIEDPEGGSILWRLVEGA